MTGRAVPQLQASPWCRCVYKAKTRMALWRVSRRRSCVVTHAACWRRQHATECCSMPLKHLQLRAPMLSLGCTRHTMYSVTALRPAAGYVM